MTSYSCCCMTVVEAKLRCSCSRRSVLVEILCCSFHKSALVMMATGYCYKIVLSETMDMIYRSNYCKAAVLVWMLHCNYCMFAHACWKATPGCCNCCNSGFVAAMSNNYYRPAVLEEMMGKNKGCESAKPGPLLLSTNFGRPSSFSKKSK